MRSPARTLRAKASARRREGIERVADGGVLQTVQRKLKDAGRFVFIDRVRGNPNFLRYIPTCRDEHVDGRAALIPTRLARQAVAVVTASAFRARAAELVPPSDGD